MTFMPWTPDLALGVEEIDSQYQELVRLTNALHDEISSASPHRETIHGILEGLVDYTHNHFIVEEVLFQQHDYPETPSTTTASRKSHGFALLRFEDGEEVSTEALDFLKDWLVHHICRVHRAYLSFSKRFSLRAAKLWPPEVRAPPRPRGVAWRFPLR